jgi:hypothetical protein
MSGTRDTRVWPSMDPLRGAAPAQTARSGSLSSSRRLAEPADFAPGQISEKAADLEKRAQALALLEGA